MNFAALFKAKRGNVGPEQLAELLRLAGLDAKFEPVPFSGRAAAFQRAAALAAAPASDVLAITGTDKNGGRLEALIVLSKKTLDTPRERR
jgi:hypothetical protein